MCQYQNAKKYFLFLPLDNLAGVCYTIRANSKKAVPVLSPAEKVIASILMRWPFLLFQKSFNYISFFSFVNRNFSKKYFLFSLLTRRRKAYIMYAVCFLPGLFVTSYRWSIKGRSLLRTTFFLFQNLPIIARSVLESIPKILEKYFIFPIDNQRKSDIITRELILWLGMSLIRRGPRPLGATLLFFTTQCGLFLDSFDGLEP